MTKPENLEEFFEQEVWAAIKREHLGLRIAHDETLKLFVRGIAQVLANQERANLDRLQAILNRIPKP